MDSSISASVLDEEKKIYSCSTYELVSKAETDF